MGFVVGGVNHLHTLSCHVQTIKKSNAKYIFKMPLFHWLLRFNGRAVGWEKCEGG